MLDDLACAYAKVIVVEDFHEFFEREDFDLARHIVSSDFSLLERKQEALNEVDVNGEAKSDKLL